MVSADAWGPASPASVDDRQRAPGDLVGVIRRYAQHAQDHLGEVRRGLVAVQVGARESQLQQGQQGPAQCGEADGRVEGGEAAGVDADLEVAEAPASDLRLRLSVNGAPRQDSTLGDMIVRPAQALTLLARFQTLDPGDLLLTGTPGGTALKAPPKPVEKIGALLPPAMKWKAFFKSQARNPKYLRTGDVVTATIVTPDGRIDLGEQHTPVTHAQ